MFNEMMEYYNKMMNSFKGVIDDSLSNLFMSEGWNQFTKVFTNYIFDFKEKNDGAMEKMLNLFRVSSKKDMDEIGDDIADLRRSLRYLKDKINELTREKNKKQ